MHRLIRVGAAVLLGASVLSVAPSVAQEAPPRGTSNPADPVEETPLEAPVDVGAREEQSLDQGRALRAWEAPEASTAKLALGDEGQAKRAGLSPVSVSATDDVDKGREVSVRIYDQETAAQVGASGFVFELTADPRTPAGVPAPADSTEETVPAEGAPPADSQTPPPADGGAGQVESVRAGEIEAREAPLEVSVDFTSLANRYGADFADRLQIVQLPACAVIDPLPKDCDVVETPLDATINRETGAIVVRINPADAVAARDPLGPVDEPTTTTPTTPEEPSTSTTIAPDAQAEDSLVEGDGEAAQPAMGMTRFGGTGGGGMVLAMTSGSDGTGGSFSATPLSQSGDWQVGQGSGGFSWSYPIPLQPGPAGDQPEMSLGYSSASIDGMTGGENNQSGMAGLGWGITEGYIERTYKTCNQDGMAANFEDLCWFSNNAVLSLNGTTARLFPVNTGETLWRMEQDPNWKIERLETAPASNTDENNEYWRVTTPDGTTYLFGRGETYENNEPTDSVWTVPVFHSGGEGDCTDAYGICNEAWRWNLDRVADTNSNITSLFYVPETNNYGLAGATAPWGYTSGGRLQEIRYGIRNGSTTTARARLVVEAAYRCNTLSDIPQPDAGSCPTPSPSNGSSFPDVPNDLICVTSCPEHNPSFFMRKRIFRFSSQIRDASGWREVDAVRLGHEWVDNTEGVEALWLRYLRRAGYSELFMQDHPTIRFNSNNLFDNRVDHNVGGGVMRLKQYRLGEIYTDSGSRIVVTYGRENPCPSTDQFPGGTNQSFTWDYNPHDCFPKWWAPPAGPSGFGAFHKYLVTKVETFDEVGGSERLATSYDYEGTPAWHYDDNPVYENGHAIRTWSEWRGYQKTTASSGEGGTPQTVTQFGVFRGMHGDRTAGGGSKTVNVSPYVGTTVPDDRWLRNKPLEERHLNSAGNAITASVHEYELRNTAYGGGGASFWAGETDRVDRRAAGAGAQYYATETTFNTDELPENVYEDGWDTTPARDGAERCTQTLYVAPSATTWMLAYPKETRVDEGNCLSTLQRRQLFYYDLDNTNGTAPTAGNLTKVVAERTSGSDTVTTEYRYDTLGRKTKNIDANGATTDISFTPTSGYPTTTTTRRWLDATNFHDTSIDWHAERKTLPVTTRDPNNKITTIAYDGLGRTLNVWLPTEQATPTQPSWKFAYQLTPGATHGVTGPIKITSEQLQSKAPLKYLTSYQFLDGNLQTVQTQSASPASGKTIVTATSYDSRGLPAVSTLPQAFSAIAGTGLVPVLPANHHQITYDNLARPTLDQFFATGAEQHRTATSYTHDTVEVDPPVGGNKRTVTDALGQTWKVQEEISTGVWHTATYVNDASGQLLTIADPSNNVITYTYNRLGQRTGMVDPDAGTWAYQYDNVGNQTRVTDNTLAQLHTEYDALGRPRIRYKNSVTPANKIAEWIYDTAPRSGGTSGEVVKGALHKTIRYQTTGPTQGDYVNTVTGYDDRNRPVSRTYQVPSSLGTLSGTYSYTYGYDFADHQTAVGYPDPGPDGPTALDEEVVTTGYSSLGQPETLGLAGAPHYVTATGFDDRGRVDTRTLGAPGTPNTVIRDYGYDNQQRLVEWKATQGPSTIIQQDIIGFDAVGNVISRQQKDPTGSGTHRECYRYDNRNRLTKAYSTTSNPCQLTNPVGGPNPYNHDFTYSSDGRMLTGNHGPGAWSYTYPGQGVTSGRPHAVTDLTGTGAPTNDCNGATTGTPTHCYDANGNMTARPGTTVGESQSLAWDAEHKLSKVDSNGAASGGQITEFVYDPDGQRLVRKTPTDTTLYIEGHEITLTGTAMTTKRYYNLGGISVAVRDSATGTLHFILGDQLGSTTVSVSAAGGTPAVQRHLPYGAPRSTSGSAVTDRGWIGQTSDGSTGLQYLNARYYDPAVGRFTAIDPLADLSRPGSLDGYGYGLGSPVTLKDPTGLFTCPDPSCLFAGGGFLGAPAPSTGSGSSSSGGGGGNTAAPKSTTFTIPKTPGIGTIKVNLFIMAKEVGGPLHYRGDGRSFSSTAGCSQSRACIILDFDRGVGTLGLNYSCRSSGSCFSPWAINGNVNKFSVSRDGEGGFSLSLSGKHADTGLAEDINPLKIDFSLSFDPASSGMTVYDAGNGEQDLSAEHVAPVLAYNRERFPSMEIYQTYGNNTYTLAQRRESSAIGGVPDGLSGTLGFFFGDDSGRVALSGPPVAGSA